MRICYTMITAVVMVAALGRAEEPKPATIVTLTGQTYDHATVTGVAPDGISVTHSAGVAKIPFTDLSPEIQRQYGYDPMKAAAYNRAVIDGQRAQVGWIAKKPNRLQERSMTSGSKSLKRWKS